jgi:hypothetical protein
MTSNIFLEIFKANQPQLFKYGNDRIEAVINEEIKSFVQILGRRLRSQTSQRGTIDMSRMLSYLATDIAAHLTLGEPFHCVKHDSDRHGFLSSIRYMMRLQHFFSVWLELWFALGVVARSPIGSSLRPKANDGTKVGGMLGVSLTN